MHRLRVGSDAHQQALPTIEYMLIRHPASGKRNANTCTKAYKMSCQETKCHIRNVGNTIEDFLTQGQGSIPGTESEPSNFAPSRCQGSLAALGGKATLDSGSFVARLEVSAPGKVTASISPGKVEAGLRALTLA
jgi:hypothetical protein